jgi:hypothetical protein
VLELKLQLIRRVPSILLLYPHFLLLHPGSLSSRGSRDVEGKVGPPSLSECVLRSVVGGRGSLVASLGGASERLEGLNHADNFSLTTFGRKFSYLYQHTKLYLSRHPDYGVRLVGT